MTEETLVKALGFRIRSARPIMAEKHSETGSIIEWTENGGVRPATMAEVRMWNLLLSTANQGFVNAYDVKDGLGTPKS